MAESKKNGLCVPPVYESQMFIPNVTSPTHTHAHTRILWASSTAMRPPHFPSHPTPSATQIFPPSLGAASCACSSSSAAAAAAAVVWWKDGGSTLLPITDCCDLFVHRCQEVTALDNIHELSALAPLTRNSWQQMDGWIVFGRIIWENRWGWGRSPSLTWKINANLRSLVCVEIRNRINSPRTSVHPAEHRLPGSAGGAAPGRHWDSCAVCNPRQTWQSSPFSSALPQPGRWVSTKIWNRVNFILARDTKRTLNFSMLLFILIMCWNKRGDITASTPYIIRLFEVLFTLTKHLTHDLQTT